MTAGAVLYKRRYAALQHSSLFLYENRFSVTASPFLPQRNISIISFHTFRGFFILIFHTEIFIPKETSFPEKKSVLLENVNASAFWSILLMNICNDNRTICDNTACSNTGFPKKHRVRHFIEHSGKADQRTYLGKDSVLLTGYGPA